MTYGVWLELLGCAANVDAILAAVDYDDDNDNSLVPASCTNSGALV